MNIKKLLLVTLFALITTTVFTACNKSYSGAPYTTRAVDFYRSIEKDENGNAVLDENGNAKPVSDRKINLRFYADTPNVPYIGVNAFYKEFYKTEFTVTQKDATFTYSRDDDCFVSFDTVNEILSVLNFYKLSSHPDFLDNTSTIFVKTVTTTNSPKQVKTVDLKNYKIAIYDENGEVYAPFQLISNLFGGTEVFIITYNEKDLYEIDYSGNLSNSQSRLEAYYGEKYIEPLCSDTERQQDVIDFTYNLLCLEFDNFRGYTSQLALVDNNLLSIGLNGTLETQAPQIKEFLLSKNREEYFAGLLGLFRGLSDGGHTSTLSMAFNKYSALGTKYTGEAEIALNTSYFFSTTKKHLVKASLSAQKKEKFGLEKVDRYYYADKENDIAFIGFDSFAVDFNGWDTYYKQIAAGEQGTVPVDTDTYAFVREKLYQALEDGVGNLVLDLSTNGGGDTSALEGVLGLLCDAKAVYAINDTANKFRLKTSNVVDINLDGQYDELDKTETDKFKAMNIVIMTSSYSFSCGNLFPSLMKEYGFKIIGEKSGGGSCAIMLEATGDGVIYARSSFLCLSDMQGNNIDSGVIVDYDLTKPLDDNPQQEMFGMVSYEDFFDTTAVVTALNAID